MKPVRVANLLGIPLLVHPSWLLIAGLLTWMLGAQIYPEFLEDRPWYTYATMAVISALLFFASIIAHELTHSVIARAYGIPVRSITLFVLGGVANISREAKRPVAELLMAGAGPLASLLIGVAMLAGLWLSPAGMGTPIPVMVFWLGVTNVALAAFNMIPAFPMDGGRVFRSLLWLVTGNYLRSTLAAAWVGRLFGWTMISAGVIAALGYDLVVVAPGPSALWLVFVGLFLENSARAGLVQARVIAALDGYTAEGLMLADPPVVDAGMTVGALARGVLEINPRVCYFVEDAGRLAGIIGAYQMLAVPEAEWDTTTAGQAMVPSARLHAVAPERSATDVLLELETADLTHLPVVREGRVLGVIGRDRIIGLLKQQGFLGARA
ncbi:MAG: site-2 protease family protein [Dehalococcoidia bacterium]